MHQVNCHRRFHDEIPQQIRCAHPSWPSSDTCSFTSSHSAISDVTADLHSASRCQCKPPEGRRSTVMHQLQRARDLFGQASDAVQPAAAAATLLECLQVQICHLLSWTLNQQMLSECNILISNSSDLCCRDRRPFGAHSVSIRHCRSAKRICTRTTS